MQMLAQLATEESAPQLRVGRHKVMVVDDDPALRQALNLRLRANKYEVVSASDGYSALALAQKERPDLILLDLGLPAGDGFAVLNHLQQFPTLASIPVVVLTARDPQGNEEKSLKSGAAAFFQKPADNEELLAVIQTCLETGQPLIKPWPV
jgi:DNA-binding response OmpR family regulator